MSDVEPARALADTAWRERAVSKGLHAARSRAEKRVQRYLEAAFGLVDERGTTDFTIQEVIARSKQSLRGFYEYFNSKDELLLAMFEDSVLEAVADLRETVEVESEPLPRLRAFAIRLFEWCEPAEPRRKRGADKRRPISEFSVQLAFDYPERVKASMESISRMLFDLLENAAAADVIDVDDARLAASLVQQMMMNGWLGNRLIEDPQKRVTAAQTWRFCLRGLGASVDPY